MGQLANLEVLVQDAEWYGGMTLVMD